MLLKVCHSLALLLLLAGRFHGITLTVDALSTSAPNTAGVQQQRQGQQPVGNILILDHLNINHERGRHDWLKAFYFDFLGCTVDPRKAENLAKGSKTLWANIGSNQFHLPEGAPDAQVLQGTITLVYSQLDDLQSRLPASKDALKGSQFNVVTQDDSAMTVVDPWGTEFHLVLGDITERDARGSQPEGEHSDGLAMRDLTLLAPKDCNMAGIARFYERVLGAPILVVTPETCQVSVGPKQTLTFVTAPQGTAVAHDDLRDEKVEPPDGMPAFLSNYGPDLASTYQRAEKVGVTYVNPRFKRRAYTLQKALDQCMFRCIDIVDPDHVEDGPILKLEHEVRSVVKPDGTKYKSCPFDEIPQSCLEK